MNEPKNNIVELTQYLYSKDFKLYDENKIYVSYRGHLKIGIMQENYHEVEVKINKSYGGMEIFIAHGCVIDCCGYSLGKDVSSIENYEKIINEFIDWHERITERNNV